jgi:N-methylhydantoinase A/oxoprolinase/acetone carboxylase beta subunit
VTVGQRRYSVSIDTGGTFTDGYVTDGHTDVWVKADTTPHDLTEGVLACVDAAATRLGHARADLLRSTSSVRLSTTIGTNTLIDRSGPRIGLLLGRDVEWVREQLPETLPLEPDLVASIPPAASEDESAAVLRSVHLLLERGARIIVICLAAGPDLGERELAVRDAIALDYPRHYLGAVPTLPSHQITLEPDPVIRLQTAVLDAYLHPVMSRFLYRVEDELRAADYAHPMLVANADGSTTRVAKTTALRTWGSGPAGGAAAAAELSRRLGLTNVVCVDIGGTSSDISVLTSATWEYAVRHRIEGATVALPAARIESVGIGGGSIARVAEGRLQVGPRSAGAHPGPAAFGLGGEEATVTDAALTIGILDPERFLGGRKRLHAEAARTAVVRNVAEALGKDATAAAWDILEVAATVVAQRVSASLEDRGLRAADSTLFAVGGAGGLLADRIGRLCGAPHRYAFLLSPVFSAFGVSTLDVSHAYDFTTASSQTVEQVIADLVARARMDMRGEGVAGEDLRFDVEVERDDGDIRTAAMGAARDPDVKAAAAFLDREAPPGRLARLRVTSPLPNVPGADHVAKPGSPRGSRDVAWASGRQSIQVHEWSSLQSGTAVTGPAIIESDETTVLVPPDTEAIVTDHGGVRFGHDA